MTGDDVHHALSPAFLNSRFNPSLSSGPLVVSLVNPSHLHPRRRTSVFRYLFPQTSFNSRNRLASFRLATVPYYKHRTQARIYRFIVERQIKRQERKAQGSGVLEYLRRHGRGVFGATNYKDKDAESIRRTAMSTPRYGQGGNHGLDYAKRQDYGRDGGPPPSDAPEQGGRRKKIAGYLRAANELRQSYQSSASARWEARRAEDLDEENIPGAFPDVSIVRQGHEELVLFPSYCKRHVKQRPDSGLSSDSVKRTESHDSTDSAQWWRQAWEKYEDDKAIVDVDVRGWVYTPHTGPMNRKNRFLLGLARQLSGIPAPKTPASKSDEDNPDSMSLKARHDAREALREQERITHEAEAIMQKGENESEIASRGGYSEGVKEESDTESLHSYRGRTRGSDTTRDPNDPPGPGRLPKRASWNQPADMTSEELKAANTNLMTRIMPFLTNPLVSTPVTVFFYDEKSSQSKTVMTNEAGHFNLRAALDFVPTHIRVLASENLSATEEVKITEPEGVSMISDVDDTIKHSSIGSGAREIFRNAFIRDLSDLTIDGVKEWYNAMYDMGVGIHYVSNSPWQLFPVLVTFFQTAGLPPGSYHLKQYSGMLQGIFEPVAERKKSTLERILNDFPERKFLLVGDSGEADLEVYTDIVLSNPGRIIGVFIRDVTTPVDKPFFDESYNASYTDRKSVEKSVNQGSFNVRAKSAKSDETDNPNNRPPLPARGATEVIPQVSNGPKMGNLIDFDDGSDVAHQPCSPVLSRSNSDLAQLESSSIRSKSIAEKGGKAPPPRPTKPLSLRSNTFTSDSAPGDSTAPEATFKPAHQVHTRTSEPNNPLPEDERQKFVSRPRNRSYLSSARAKASQAYSAMPDVSSYIPSISSNSDLTQLSSDSSHNPPLPRRGLTATAAGYAASASNRLTSYRSHRDNSPSSSKRPSSSDSDNPSNASTPPINKKLDMWNRRWARAKELLQKEGVVLGSWRKGEDVSDEAVRLVERALREMRVEGYGEGGEGKGKTGQGGGEAKVVDLKR